ncbi:RNA polymerase sigma factor [Saccharospirillum impatiens]|uniref:RNA polymerase sigma factor n=1 Tax=Saccharospirillum impatiens TaxID=169438 RepID=UPI00041AB4FC|nr:sigma-70 family RNA polymerase sigma factor [Saccharospirillum impatiens]
MRPSQYNQLCSIARRIVSDVGDAEDVAQEAYLAAFMEGRTDFDAIETRRWLVGTVRNMARMSLRGAVRRRGREHQWQLARADEFTPARHAELALPATLTPPLKAVAALALSGHNRKEITYLLKVTDATLRQRIRSLKREIAQAGLVMPTELTGLTLGLAYGSLRRALVSKLARRDGFLASHDPDGHLFVVSGSQNGHRRQLAGG